MNSEVTLIFRKVV